MTEKEISSAIDHAMLTGAAFVLAPVSAFALIHFVRQGAAVESAILAALATLSIVCGVAHRMALQRLRREAAARSKSAE